MKKRRALLSVYDKTDVVELGRGLVGLGFELVSSGGTSGVLKAAGIPRFEVEEVTFFPEMMGGRLKTLHPKLFGGILANRSKESDLDDAKDHDIVLIDLVVCNLYPFSETVASGASVADCIEKIDVGGPSMVRAAAKNYVSVGVVVHPADYSTVLEELRVYGNLTNETRLALAVKAFGHTAAYDTAIHEWMSALK